jgi:N-acetyl-anhydromuramyl-L-alanine amidase AmpD
MTTLLAMFRRLFSRRPIAVGQTYELIGSSDPCSEATRVRVTEVTAGLVRYGYVLKSGQLSTTTCDDIQSFRSLYLPPREAA